MTPLHKQLKTVHKLEDQREHKRRGRREEFLSSVRSIGTMKELSVSRTC